MKKIILVVCVLAMGLFSSSCFAATHSYRYINTLDSVQTFLDTSTYAKYDNNIYEFTSIANDSSKNVLCIMRIVANSNTKQYYVKYITVFKDGGRVEGTPYRQIKDYQDTSSVDISIRVIDSLSNGRSA